MGPNAILFSRFAAHGDKIRWNDLFSIEPDRSGEAAVTQNPDSEGRYHDNTAGRFDSTRSRIAFLRSTESHPDRYQVCVLNLADGSVVQITDGRHDFGSVDWSPDDRKLLVTAVGDNGRMQIFDMNADGSGLTRLTHDDAEYFNAVYSPAGDKIAYERLPHPDNRNICQIWVADPRNEDPVSLTVEDGLAMQPSWSPDGEWLAFAAEPSDLLEIYKVNVATRDFAKLSSTSAGGNDSQPVWTENGIIFSTDRDMDGARQRACLYIMDSDGGNVRNLTAAGDAFEYACDG